jgi:hypothetical protein
LIYGKEIIDLHTRSIASIDSESVSWYYPEFQEVCLDYCLAISDSIGYRRFIFEKSIGFGVCWSCFATFPLIPGQFWC